MKLTKKLEAEILKVYHTFWDANLSGDMRTLASCLDPEITVFGTAISEVFRDKKTAVRFYKATASQMAGKAQFRNRRIRLQAVGDTVLAGEECDLFFLAGKQWNFYGHCRVSALFQSTKSGWKIIHTHGSFPDSRAEEGEQIAAEKIKEENGQLREAVKRRTVELEEKNRELEIDAALEKVRAVAMSMNKPDDMLNVCQTISLQLEALGLKHIRNVQTAIFYESRGTYMNYEYYARHRKTFITEVDYTNHKLAKAFAAKMLKGKGEVSVTHIKGQKVKDWIAYQKSTNVFIDKYLHKADSLHYYWHSLGPVALGISSYKPLAKEEQGLFNRFLLVFELAYTRYLDIEKAVEQTREAQIELALERVRARAMAMRHSDELSHLIFELYQELTKLDARLDRAFIMIVNPENQGITWWMAGYEGLLAENGFFVQMNQYPTHLLYLDNWKQRKKKWQYLFEGKEKKDWDRFGFNKTELARMPESVKMFMASQKRVYLSGSSDQFGSLVAGSFEPLPQEQQDIISRFTIVFNQSYTRFLDLQKAEAQAREAQIQLAMERVRARAMAMQKSDELQDAAILLFQQLKSLGIQTGSCGFNIWNKEKKSVTVWMSSPEGGLQDPFDLTLTKSPVYKPVYAAMKEGKDFLVKEVGGKNLVNHFEYLETVPGIGDVIRHLRETHYTFPETMIYHFAFFGQGFLSFHTHESYPEAHAIFKRFAAVFEQTYTRFLDLQNAEAQARESQIQLALERVRARTMAMQRSEELQETSLVLFQQLKILGEPAEQCTIGIIKESEGVVEISATFHGNKMHQTFRHKIDEPFVMHKLFRGWKDQQNSLVLEIKGRELEMYNQYRNELTGKETFPVKLLPGDRWIIHLAYFSAGMLALSTNEPRPAESLQLLERFAKVFEQTYTRFLDLQKAEAQAREAQIELGLERVRASAMAMHNSEGLYVTAEILYKEFIKLGIESSSSGFGLVDENANKISFYGINPADGKIIRYANHVPLNETKVFQTIFSNWKNQETAAVIELNKKQTVEHETYVAKYTLASYKEYGIEAPFTVEDWLANSPEEVIFHWFNFPQGLLYSIRDKRLTVTQQELVARFTKVFQLTYTRFLDLQKAEAQAKEARIEAALERVRSRAMAMHRSSELADAATLLYRELQLLGISQFFNCGYVLIDEPLNIQHAWLTHADGTIRDEHTMPLTGDSIMNERFEQWKHKVPVVCQQLGGKPLQVHLAFVAGHSDLSEVTDVIIPNMPDPTFFYCGNFSEGYLHLLANKALSKEEENILSRFTSVFEITFRRFRDLEKAEAQARESQIQLALERVRARSMAMHKSDELAEAAQLLYQEFGNLGINSFSCGYMFIDEAKQTQTAWVVMPDGSVIPDFISFPLTGDEVLNRRYKDWKEKKPLHITEIQGEANKAHHRFLSGFVPAFVVDEIFSKIPDHIIFNCANFSDGYLLILATEHFSLPDQQTIIRFAKVFEQTYTRFLDLQKAEAQAREARIETALERVRSKTMAMHNSQDVAATVASLFDELVKLGIDKSIRCGIGILDDSPTMELWTASSGADGEVTLNIGKLDLRIHPLLEGVHQAWKMEAPGFTYELAGQDLVDYYSAISNAPDYHFQVDIQTLPERVIHTDFFFPDGSLYAFTREALPAEVAAILKRFAAVFGQTYRRYLDLQKAEAQAREAQVEVSLERVRSRTMIMQQSRELNEAAELLYRELGKLEIPIFTCGYVLVDEKTDTGNCYMANPEGSFTFEPFRISQTGNPVFCSIYQSWKNREDYYTIRLEGEENIAHNRYLAEESDKFPIPVDLLLSILPPVTVSHSFNFNSGYLLVVSLVPYTGEQYDVLVRFARVFEQTYTRFLDLQKAEAQAREAKIEVSLERVRSKAMAMHKTDDLTSVVEVVFNELDKLQLGMMRCGIGILHRNKRTADVWTTAKSETGTNIQTSGDEPMDIHPLLQGDFDAWLRQEDFSYVLEGKDLENYYQALTETNFKLPDSASFETIKTDLKQYYYVTPFESGTVFAFRETEFPAEAKIVMKRFANVFNLTYKRFLDLQKAEAQAREAQIEAALERVRARTMAMHQSDELSDCAELLFSELSKLGGSLWSSGFAILKEDEEQDGEYRTTDQFGMREEVTYIPNTGDPTMHHLYNGWRQGKAYISYVLAGEEIRQHYKNMVTLPRSGQVFQAVLDAGQAFPDWQQMHAAYFKQGYLLVISLNEYKESDLLIRFAKVFEQTYTRFLDLQKAEAQAREAQIETALEKVRSRSLAMQKTEELQEVVAIVAEKLKELGVILDANGTIICTYFPDSKDVMHWMAVPDFSSSGSYLLPYFDHPIFNATWESKISGDDYFSKSFTKDEKDSFFQYAFEHSDYRHFPDEFKQWIFQNDKHSLSFAWAKNSAILLPSHTGILPSENDQEILKRFVRVFEQAYIRFMDLQKAEQLAKQAQIDLENLIAAKKKTEEALTELKATQSQLIQSEKMASLGELTAGIAHEIQNPLNFVNNFSEVSQELLDEMKAELDKGDTEEAKAIADNVKQNLDKILHHGKRADGIVKGMLQHSSAGSGKKEPTDINALADEYLRLAYHGLRAKDKSFNATMKTDFDETIGNISIIPQDMGRVILNLITNAFYACTERRTLSEAEVSRSAAPLPSRQIGTGSEGGVSDPDYKHNPTVWVSTKKEGNQVLISVRDNGPGIPQKILDKIFQPFFTTKPTGQGTGLGLSLSFDIVKAHGGELKVETIEGVGSEFIIHLPFV